MRRRRASPCLALPRGAARAVVCERYPNTPLFAGVGVDIDEAEREISRSTPGFQLVACDVRALWLARREQPGETLIALSGGGGGGGAPTVRSRRVAPA